MKFRAYAKNRETGLCAYCDAENIRDVKFDKEVTACLIEYPNPKDFKIITPGLEGYEVIEIMYEIQ